ncbi:MAG TPA: efflux RND transporter periplasmic adaptor subunit [Rhodocyclaceae bacterium]|nr:efflux RND transporter periplasmic adaptor subunit [Rhodocyclaceae bacterium]
MAMSWFRGRGRLLGAVVVAVLGAGGWWWHAASVVPEKSSAGDAPRTSTHGAAIRPSLTVTVTSPRKEDWLQSLSVDGNVVAWQEAVIGAELDQYRITEIDVQVGDTVKKGQVLARIADDTVASELAEAGASVTEQEAVAGEAKGNAERAQALRAQGFYSQQMQTQFTTAERTAQARLAAARARLQSAELRMQKTSVTAPDGGIISARAATVGSLTQPGQELFRLIRGGRIEWQAEVPAVNLTQIRPGAQAILSAPNGEQVQGKVRTVAPSVDPRTRNGIVFVDLPATKSLRAGIFVRGEIETGRGPALTLPQSAVVLREGHAYVFRLATESSGTSAAAQTHVEQIRVKTGRRSGERIEIVEGIEPAARIVTSGAGFLADGDVVMVVADAAGVAEKTVQ